VVKAAWAVILAGLGIMVPGIRDLFLWVLIAAINWILELLKRPPLPPDVSAPWWAGLILVVLGLLLLVFYDRRHVRIRGIVEKNGTVFIEGSVKSSDPADMERLLKLMKERLKDLTGEEPPE
jgi:hypothetical protein